MLCGFLVACREPVRGPVSKPAPEEIAKGVTLAEHARGFAKPVAMAWVPGTERVLVVERAGTVRELVDGKPAKEPWLDLSKDTSMGEEQGLFYLVFHPRFAENGLFYYSHTDAKGDERVVERKADPKTLAIGEHARELLFIDKQTEIHNAGGMAFGPDGWLYVGIGDGGPPGDPRGNTQDERTLYGKIHRFDVDSPRLGHAVFLKGARNPWRFSFDRKTGDFYLGDVGHDRYEEIDVLAAGIGTGANLGWNVVEGMHCYREGCDLAAYRRPVIEYAHPQGCAVTGGYVYRGKSLPELDGVYFYADFCTALVRSFRWKGGTEIADAWDWRKSIDARDRLSLVVSWAEAPDGELYLVSMDGTIWKLVRT